MKIEVLGTGCATCRQLHEITKQAAADLDPQAQVAYISGTEGMQRLMGLGLMQSPALLVNGKIAMTGYSPNIQTIKTAILEAARP